MNTRVKLIAVDAQKELIDAAVQHAVACMAIKIAPKLREQIGELIKAELSEIGIARVTGSALGQKQTYALQNWGAK